jgi:hypothetical protein
MPEAIAGVPIRRLQPFALCAAIATLLTACHSLPTGTVTANNVTVTLSPPAPTIGTFATQSFTATVTGTTNTALTWQVNGVTGGSTTTGTISSSGVYSAPHYISGSIIPANGNAVTVTITAISQADTAASGSSTLTLEAQGQAAQTGAVELGTSGSNLHASTQSGNSITCCGGTLGSLLVRNGTNYILSNNHVMANSDSGTIGDAIIQPGLIDNPAPNTCTSTGTTTIANLSQFFTLEGNPPDPVDAAIAQIVSGKVDTSGNILLLGATADANGVPVPGAPHAGSGVDASLGMAVAKSGRSSGLTCSTIETTPATFSVDYAKTCGGSTSFSVTYSNQVGVSGGDFSQEGDSGSLIVTQDTADPVALLFAGSDTDTVGNPMSDVLQAMVDSSNHVPTLVGGAAHQVIGCSLAGPNSAQKTVPAIAVAQDDMQAAAAARDNHAAQILAIPGVRGLGIGPSLDYVGQAAVLIFVLPGTAHNRLPPQLDSVRTRIVETSNESATGILNAQDSQTIAPQQPAISVISLSAAETARAKAAHSANVEVWMKQPGVQGFGVSASADSPGEATLMIFLIRGALHNAIPTLIDGVRTRVRESSRLHAGLDGLRPRTACTVSPVKTTNPGVTKIAQPKAVSQ